MRSLVPATHVAAFTSFARETSKATRKAALLLFSVAVLLAGAAAAVRGQSALDGFDPNANDAVRVVVVQPDGKILIGGDFTTLSNGGVAVTRNRIARLNSDGTLDTAFDPNANGSVYSIAVQADGKILAGGVFTSIGGQTRNRIAREGNFDVIILDVMLPGKNGFDVCRDLRQQSITTPILMLTARGQVIDKVLGLKLGADDYLCKPFEPLELLARLEALLRRSQTTASAAEPLDAFSFGSVIVNFRSTEVLRNGKQVELSAREFQLLCYFIAQRGATLSRDELLREVWGYDTGMLTRTVDVHVGWLRQKLEDDAKDPRHFLTMRGHGYKFVA